MKTLLNMGIIASIISLFGCNSSTQNENPSENSEESNIQYMDPNDILMTIPTIENSLPGTTDEELAELNLEITEDDWRQIELISKDFMPEINKEIDGINSIFENDTADMGEGMLAFRNLHVRELIPTPLKTLITESKLLKSFSNSARGSLSFMQFGRVKNGYFVETNSFRFYGTSTNGQLECIGFYGKTSFDQLETFKSELKAFMSENNLVLVDWFPRLVVDTDGIDEYLAPPTSE